MKIRVLKVSAYEQQALGAYTLIKFNIKNWKTRVYEI
jgi:hypothetical protein